MACVYEGLCQMDIFVGGSFRCVVRTNWVGVDNAFGPPKQLSSHPHSLLSAVLCYVAILSPPPPSLKALSCLS